MKINNLTRTTYGNLTIVGDSGERTTSGNVKWICKCVCGNTLNLTSRNLKTKVDLSCGCLNPKHKAYFNKIKKLFEDNGCVCLETSYKPAKSKWRFICQCGNRHSIYPDDFKKGRRCAECGKKSMREKIRTPEDEIRKTFENSTDTLQKIYFNKRAYVVYKCKNGHINNKQFTSYKNGNGCKKCSNQRGSDKLRKTEKEVSKELEGYGMEYIGGYKNADLKFTFKCTCGNIAEGYIGYLRKGGKCGCEYKKGTEHPKYDHSISLEERQLRRNYYSYREWVRNVFERDNYTCQSCWQHGGKLNAHHIMPYRAYPELRTELNNGITLCNFCHRTFHSIYNIQGFNRDDLIDFLDFTKEERWF